MPVLWIVVTVVHDVITASHPSSSQSRSRSGATRATCSFVSILFLPALVMQPWFLSQRHWFTGSDPILCRAASWHVVLGDCSRGTYPILEMHQS